MLNFLSRFPGTNERWKQGNSDFFSQSTLYVNKYRLMWRTACCMLWKFRNKSTKYDTSRAMPSVEGNTCLNLIHTITLLSYFSINIWKKKYDVNKICFQTNCTAAASVYKIIRNYSFRQIELKNFCENHVHCRFQMSSTLLPILSSTYAET